MNWWKEWQSYLNRAREWDSPVSSDSDITSIKKMMQSIERNDAEIGDRVWSRLRPHLQPLEAPAAYVSSLWAALASGGPRFALGAAVALILMAGVFLNQETVSSRLEVASVNPLSLLSENSADDPIEIVQARNGDELLQFIAYGSSQR